MFVASSHTESSGDDRRPVFRPLAGARPTYLPVGADSRSDQDKGPVELLVIGVSTGGPQALARLLPHLPASFPVPILVVQHMPPLFTRMLAEKLDQNCPLNVREAVDGARVQAGDVWIARGDWHMELRRDEQGLLLEEHQGAQVHSCRPAVDVLFASAIQNCGSGVLAMILTGIGRDGVEGARRVRQAGGTVLVQDESSSVVWGMPGAVVQTGSADEVLDLEGLAAQAIRLAMHGRSLNT